MARGYNTFLFQIDDQQGTPKQTQIREFFVKAILNRSLMPGDTLPSTRILAEQLSVSRNTVILAYQALTDSGYIESLDRSGCIVSPDAPVSPFKVTEQAAPSHDDQDEWGDKFIRPSSQLNINSQPLKWREYDYP
ncbi:MAG: GntR family transcriptional regulator, partial [Alphaproteobacteria bacterium]|nr:GntR family transcriptional regulator [Alphaproteobacteria bacterium]